MPYTSLSHRKYRTVYHKVQRPFCLNSKFLWFQVNHPDFVCSLTLLDFFLKFWFYPYGEIFLCLQLPKASEFLKWRCHSRSKMTVSVPWSWPPVVLPCAVAVCRVRAILYIQFFSPPSCKTKGFGCFPKANRLCQLSCTNRKNNQPKQHELLYPRPWVAGHRFPAEVTGKVNSSKNTVFAMPFQCTAKAVPSPSPLLGSKSHSAV